MLIAAYAMASSMVPIWSTSPIFMASAPAHTRPCAMASTDGTLMSLPSDTMPVNLSYIFSTDACMYAISFLSRGRIPPYMSACLLEFTGVMFTRSLPFIVPLKSGIMLNTPIEPVRVVALEKM